jgi:hypothetical protein
MERRKLLSSSLAASALALSGSSFSQQAVQTPSATAGREYYLLRRYQLLWGPQVRAAHNFFRDALVPALNRLGIKPVGVFNARIGPDTPAIYVLLPCTSLEMLANLEEHLAQDSEYLKAGAAFLNAPSLQPSYVRVQATLLRALEGWPKLILPAATAQHGPRLFELRTYENLTDQDHKRKIEMINAGYYDIFQKAGFWQIFYGDTLVGARMPDLTYMLGFSDMAERDKNWAAFFASPAWKSLSTLPRYTFEDIVSKVSNIVLSPADYSQI